MEERASAGSNERQIVVRPLTNAPSQPAGRQLIDRPALTARFLQAADRRCVVFHAPAGYGKTSAVTSAAINRFSISS